MMEIPPPMPTVRDAILDLDRRFQQLTVRTVRDRLRELRGFDASTKEIAAALRDFKHGERMAWAGEAAARAWMAASLPDDLDGTTARHWLRLGFREWDEATSAIRKRERGAEPDER